jgi:hypothetical protein
MVQVFFSGCSVLVLEEYAGQLLWLHETSKPVRIITTIIISIILFISKKFFRLKWNVIFMKKVSVKL